MINNDKKVKLKPQLKEIQNQSPKTLKEALEEIEANALLRIGFGNFLGNNKRHYYLHYADVIALINMIYLKSLFVKCVMCFFIMEQ